MNYADIRPIDVANGPGVRVSLFVSGCPHRCPGCFNPETWDFQYGQGFGEEQVRSILDLLRPGYIRGLTLLGGEPMAPANQPEVLSLVRRVRQELPGRDIWCYTGYLYEELAAGRVGPLDRELLHELDVLVDIQLMKKFPVQRPLPSGAERHPPPFPWQCQPAYPGCSPVPGGRGGPLVGQPPGLNPAAALSFQGCRSCFYPAGRTFPLPFSGFLC